MATETLTERARPSSEGSGPARFDRYLGHPLAFVLTGLILLALFSWPFLTDPNRVAPTKDPAYYTWRTEALISEDPSTLLEITGPFDLFAGGYRVAAPVIGGLLRHVPGVSQLNVIAFLMVLVPVLTALLLGGFAYRERRDPLLFHSVAFFTAGLYFTPPFVGYLDNIMCLFFLAAALLFLRPARDSWAGRIGFGIFLLMAGFTHPTTLAIFCFVLGIMAFGRLIYRRFDIRSVIRDDGPVLATAFGVAVLTYVIWKIGPWGPSASLSEAALPPPYGSDFFVDRMVLWIKAMRPVLNGPLLVIGAIGILAAGRKAAEDELSRVSIVWLAPLAGLFGFVGGLTYPYYRFFNSTLAWVLLVGVGGYFVMRYLFGIAERGGASRLALLGVVAVGVIIATNFTNGYKISGWTNPNNEWLSPQEREDLDALRAALDARFTEDSHTPVIFVVDDEPPKPFQIYGFTKLSGNTSRYGLPSGHIDQGYEYLGSLENLLNDKPTLKDDETYDKLSKGFFEDARGAAIALKGLTRTTFDNAIIVVASIFNPAGANAEIAAGEAQLPEGTGDNVWIVHDGLVQAGDVAQGLAPEKDSGSPLHLLQVLIGLALLLVLPGFLALRWLLPDAQLAESLGLVPAVSLAFLALAGVIVLAVASAPLSAALAWGTWAVATGIGAILYLLAGRSTSGEATAQA